MSTQSNSKNLTKNESNLNSKDIKLGGFPPIIFQNQQNKKLKEFAKINNNEENIKNISKLNILNINDILGKK